MDKDRTGLYIMLIIVMIFTYGISTDTYRIRSKVDKINEKLDSIMTLLKEK